MGAGADRLGAIRSEAGGGDIQLGWKRDADDVVPLTPDTLEGTLQLLGSCAVASML